MAIRSVGLLAALALAAAALSAGSAKADDPAAADPQAVACATPDGGFAVAGPPGWVCEPREDTVEVALRPARPAAEADVAIGVAAAATAGPAGAPALRAANPHELVQRTLVNRAGPDGPADVVPFDAPHPTLETAGGAIELSEGEVYAVAVRAPGGAGDYLVALLTKTGGPATAEELALFRRTIASLRSPTRAPRAVPPLPAAP